QEIPFHILTDDEKVLPLLLEHLQDSSKPEKQALRAASKVANSVNRQIDNLNTNLNTKTTKQSKEISLLSNETKKLANECGKIKEEIVTSKQFKRFEEQIDNRLVKTYKDISWYLTAIIILLFIFLVVFIWFFS
ncbi:MAG: hypothetical protein U9O98_11315, partial [Asgard group archaeon]|nr:hypothetical protein [Asgard group archaeon]